MPIRGLRNQINIAAEAAETRYIPGFSKKNRCSYRSMQYMTFFVGIHCMSKEFRELLMLFFFGILRNDDGKQ